MFTNYNTWKAGYIPGHKALMKTADLETLWSGCREIDMSRGPVFLPKGGGCNANSPSGVGQRYNESPTLLFQRRHPLLSVFVPRPTRRGLYRTGCMHTDLWSLGRSNTNSSSVMAMEADWNIGIHQPTRGNCWIMFVDVAMSDVRTLTSYQYSRKEDIVQL